MPRHTRTIHMSLSVFETKMRHGGNTELVIDGHTKGAKHHKIVIDCGPSTLAYIAEELHKTERAYRDAADGIRKALRGDA